MSEVITVSSKEAMKVLGMINYTFQGRLEYERFKGH